MNVNTSYLGDVYNVSNFAKIVDKAIPLAKQIRRERNFDTIAFSGCSGAALAYILSAELHVPLICIRKKDEDSHFNSMGVFEGSLIAKRYIIVDDFICGGNTVHRIQKAVHDKVPSAICVAYMLYASREVSRTEFDGTPCYCVQPYQPNYDQRSFSFPGWYGV